MTAERLSQADATLAALEGEGVLRVKARDHHRRFVLLAHPAVRRAWVPGVVALCDTHLVLRARLASARGGEEHLSRVLFFVYGLSIWPYTPGGDGYVLPRMEQGDLDLELVYPGDPLPRLEERVRGWGGLLRRAAWLYRNADAEVAKVMEGGGGLGDLPLED